VVNVFEEVNEVRVKVSVLGVHFLFTVEDYLTYSVLVDVVEEGRVVGLDFA